jgi:cytochrome P450
VVPPEGEADAAAPAGDVPAHASVPRLPFAQACANEAMRLHPVGPLHYLEACHDTVVADVAVPERDLPLLPDAHGRGRCRQAAASGEFMPERWFDPEHEHALKRLSIPFGAGARLCPGRTLAMLEMRMLLSMLARDFELADVSTAHGRPPQERMGFTATRRVCACGWRNGARRVAQMAMQLRETARAATNPVLWGAFTLPRKLEWMLVRSMGAAIRRRRVLSERLE